MLNNLSNIISPVIESAKISKIFLAVLVDSPVIDLVIINVLLIITNHLIEIEIDRHHIILIGHPLIWSCFKSYNQWLNSYRSVVLSLFQYASKDMF